MHFSRLIDLLNTAAPLLVDAALRGAIVLLAALALTWMMRRRSAAARHLVWVGAIVVQLALPLFGVWGPQWSVAVPTPVADVMPSAIVPSTPAISSVNAAGLQAPAVRTPAPDVRTVIAAPPIAQVPVGEPFNGRRLLLTLWIAGAAIVLARLAAGTASVARLARQGTRVDDGTWLSLAQKLSTRLDIDRPLTLLRGDRLGVPVTWGIVYPVVLLPDDADEWTEERRRFVLVHEMAHVKRLDALTQLAGQFALALFWFNPLVWIANRRMQLEREHACDDYVLRHGTAPSLYAEELLSMVRTLGVPGRRHTQPAFAALAMARRSEFEGRMLSILDPVLDRNPLRRGRAALVAIAALVLVVPLAALHPYREPEPAIHVVARQARDTIGATPQPDTATHATSVVSAPTAHSATHATAASSAFASAFSALSGAGQATSASVVTVMKGPRSCDDLRSPRGSATSLHSDDSGDVNAVLTYLSYNESHCASARFNGHPKFSADENEIVALPNGAHVSVREQVPGMDRQVDASADGSSSAVQYTYNENGHAAAYDAEAKRWFGGFLRQVLMESGTNTRDRVSHWRQEGGISKVLANIATLSSANAKRTHYEALLDEGNLSAGDMALLVRSASENLSGSTGDLRTLLSRVAPSVPHTPQVTSALEQAIGSMHSSGDKAGTLELYGQTDDKEMLLAIMRVSNTLASSGDHARLLQVLAPRYLTRDDRALEAAFFESLKGVASSGDQRNTLIVAESFAMGSTNVTEHIIDAATRVASSGDQAAVLTALVTSGAVRTKSLRDSFFKAAASIPSEGDRARVLQAAATIRP